MDVVLDLNDVTFIVTAVLRAVCESQAEGKVEDLVNNWESDELDELRDKVVVGAQPELNKLFAGLEVESD